jgi:dienelactone hydrolase
VARTRTPRLTSARQALDELSRPGPHTVLHGDLGLTGLPGVVYTPAEGLGLPAVAFGHDWLQPPQRYLPLLRHLASWGFVAAAPASQLGPLPSPLRLAADLRTALAVCAGVRLGEGRISVDRAKTAFGGHGLGGGAAVLAAAADAAEGGRVAAVFTLAASQTRPSAADAARTVHVPALHIGVTEDTVAPPAGHVEPIAAAAGGPVWLRMAKGEHVGFLDGRHWTGLLLPGKPDRKLARLSRAVVTAFLLRTLRSDDRAAVLLDGKVPGTTLERSPQPA